MSSWLRGTSPAQRGGRGERIVRRPSAITRADVVSLLLGATLVVAMLGWFSWSMAANIRRDRRVDAQAAELTHAH